MNSLEDKTGRRRVPSYKGLQPASEHMPVLLVKGPVKKVTLSMKFFLTMRQRHLEARQPRLPDPEKDS